MAVEGFCSPRFDRLRDEFERSFAEKGEVGASVCVFVDGTPVADLWGGVTSRTTREPWTRDTLSLVWSCTKGAVALAAHLLVARGLLDLDAPVATYWPEFACNGKEAIRVRWLLDHQAGLPVISQPLTPGVLYDWDAMVRILAD